MNDKLREFARTSHLDVYGLGKDRSQWEYTIEKFSEMIVRECAQTVEHINMQGGGNLGDIIKQKFGVD